MPQDDILNRAAVEALMATQGIDGYADLARRMNRTGVRSVERTFVSRVMRGQRPAKPSFIVALAAALKVPTIAITGEGVDVAVEDIADGSAA